MKANISLRLVAIIIAVLFAFISAVSCGKPESGDTPAVTDPAADATEHSGSDPIITEAPSDESEAPVQSTAPTEDASSGTEPDDSETPATSDAPADTSSADTTPAPDTTETAYTTPVTTIMPASEEPSVPNTPSPVPTEIPEPDPITELTYIASDKLYYCDMDFDGTSDKVEVQLKTRDDKKQCTVKITLGSSEATLIDTFTTEKYIGGFLNNFNTGDRRMELVISTCIGKRDDTVRSYRLNSDSTGLLISETEGWIDSVEGNSVIVSKYVDLMGTWVCSCPHYFDHNDFGLLPLDEDWTVDYESGRWCTASKELLVGLYISGPDNYAGFIEKGDKLYPTATDLKERIDFMTDTNVSGYINVTFDPKEGALYDGSGMDAYFSDLTYIR